LCQQKDEDVVKRWPGRNKVVEECSELNVELSKLAEFPTGSHPGRKRSLILSTEDELADVLAAVNYFIDRNSLDRTRIERRAKAKYKKFSKWWGTPALVAKIASKVKTVGKKSRAKATRDVRNV
jgi:NTP pyrophosphatase (non-canonical NTP hydrolase)